MALVVAGEIGAFAFGFTPEGWAACDGRTLPIAEYGELYAVLGTTYGGDGRSTFALPDLRDSVMVGAGQGAGTSNYAVGQQVGIGAVVLNESNLPGHQHFMFALNPPDASASVPTPSTTALFTTCRPKFTYAHLPTPGPGNIAFFSSAMCGGTGGPNVPHDNRQPALALNFCIALYPID